MHKNKNAIYEKLNANISVTSYFYKWLPLPQRDRGHPWFQIVWVMNILPVTHIFKHDHYMNILYLHLISMHTFMNASYWSHGSILRNWHFHCSWQHQDHILHTRMQVGLILSTPKSHLYHSFKGFEIHIFIFHKLVQFSSDKAVTYWYTVVLCHSGAKYPSISLNPSSVLFYHRGHAIIGSY